MQTSQQPSGTPQSPLFDLGQVVATAAVNGQLSPTQRGWMAWCLHEHTRGIWGEVDDHDHAANNEAVTTGDRILSVYSTPQGIKTDADTIWIITDATNETGNRHTTTILYPHEY